MELRDKLNTKEKYQELIQKKEEFIQRDIIEFEEFYKDWSKDRIHSHMARTFMYSYQVLISKYSMGLPVSEIIEDYKRTISFMDNGWQGVSDYVEMVWILSIGIMIDAGKEIFDKLKFLIERDNLNDYLIDYLLQNSTLWGKQTYNFLFPHPYKVTEVIISLAQTDKNKTLERLTKYLQKEWYIGHADTGWYDTHKSKWNIHSGYWSFESGAIVKILGLDDRSLKEQQYYPYDMVHWKDEN